jgi:hypothetical protein
MYKPVIDAPESRLVHKQSDCCSTDQEQCTSSVTGVTETRDSVQVV